MFESRKDGSLESVALREMKWLTHSFGTRHSDGVVSDLPAITLRQVHSDRCILANQPGSAYPEGDALITDVPGHVIAVRTADCLPILLAVPSRRLVAAIHAGWRGTVSQITAKTVRRLRQEFGAVSEEIVAVVGPGIQSCCFEVGPEVAIEFRDLFPERDDLDQRTCIDLAEANLRQILEAGVRRENLTVSEACTMCGSDKFHSYRRDRGAAGRMVSAIGIVTV